MVEFRRYLVWGAFCALACSVERTLDTATEGSSTAVSTTSAGASGPSTDGATSGPSGTGTATAGTGTAETGTATSGTSGPVDDGMCADIDQSCPEGQKCTNVASPGSRSPGWDTVACVPAVPNGGGIDAPCGFAEGASVWSGLDDCVGDPSIPDFFCAYGDPNPVGSREPCEYVNHCQAGLSCQTGELVADCPPGAFYCCTPYCSVSGGPGPCAPGEACVPFYEDPPSPELADVGVCLLPA